MGRPLNKKFFGANADNNLKVQFHNGTTSVKGYIVKQLGNKKFKCEDVNGNTAICRLVTKNSADLAAGEMSITVKYDDGTVRHVYKIAAHRISVNPVTNNNTTVGMTTAGWSFSTSTSDQRWQIEEAGTNAAMSGSVDLEGDDINGDYPVPGSGTFKSAATALSGVTYANKGTPYAPGGNVSSVTNAAAGLWRSKYDGNYCALSNTAPASWNYNWFSTATLIKSIADTNVSWGQQTDGTEFLYGMERLCTSS
jgi:hypothetical protein